MPKLLLALLALLALVIPGVPSGAASYHALGCKTDPSGDAAGVDEADLLEICANYFEEDPSVVVVSFDAVADFDPLDDPAWLNDDTVLSVGISIDEDDETDRTFRIIRVGDNLVGEMLDADGDAMDGCDDPGDPGDDTVVVVRGGGFLAAQFAACLIDDADTIRFAGTMAYQETAGGAVAVDSVPDESLSAPLPKGDEPPVCANPTVDEEADLTIRRLACGIGGTEPISQGVATSQFVFDNPDTPAIDPYQADWAVIARDDDFADALAGSTLTFGQGPLLFTYSPASAAALGQDPDRLAAITRAELTRVLPRGRTVYLLGGSAALAPGLDLELEELGYDVVRFAGTGRENTAHLIAVEVRRIVSDFSEEFGFPDVRMAFVVNSRNWPDAVLAGSVGAYWGMPILLTDAVSLHPETAAAITELGIDYIHVAGGQAVVSTDVLRQMRMLVDGRQETGVDLNDPNSPYYGFCVDAQTMQRTYGCRWGGNTRFQTSGFIGQLNREMLKRFGGTHPFIPADQQEFAASINLAIPNGFPYAMAAATVSGRFGGAVFVAADGQAGDVLNDDVKFYTCPYIQDIDEILLIGDTDVIAPSFLDLLRGHYANPATSSFNPPCDAER